MDKQYALDKCRKYVVLRSKAAHELYRFKKNKLYLAMGFNSFKAYCDWDQVPVSYEEAEGLISKYVESADK